MSLKDFEKATEQFQRGIVHELVPGTRIAVDEILPQYPRKFGNLKKQQKLSERLAYEYDISQANNETMFGRRYLDFDYAKDVLKTRNELELQQAFDLYQAETLRRTNDPSLRYYLNKVDPEFNRARVEELAEEMELAIRWATLKVLPPNSLDDLILLFLIYSKQYPPPRDDWYMPISTEQYVSGGANMLPGLRKAYIKRKYTNVSDEANMNIRDRDVDVTQRRFIRATPASNQTVDVREDQNIRNRLVTDGFAHVSLPQYHSQTLPKVFGYYKAILGDTLQRLHKRVGETKITATNFTL